LNKCRRRKKKSSKRKGRAEESMGVWECGSVGLRENILTEIKFMNSKWLTALVLLLPFLGSSQKRVGELSLVYNTVISNTDDSSKKITSATSYFLKGNLSRAEISNSMFSSVTIYDSKSGTGVILKEVNGQKLLIRMNEENWNQKNRRFLNLNFARSNESKMIAGYACTKATASAPDGFDITVFYTRDLIPENKWYDATFKNLDGLPLEYELKKGTVHIKYSLASINLNPVPASKFDIPTSGYRELTYEESLKMKGQ
jgi:GLPGLI family protein